MARTLSYLLHTLAVLSVSLFSTIDAAYPTFLVPTANTAPRSVSEDEALGTSILTLKGQDTDEDTLTFSIVTQNPTSPPFELESVTGLLKVPSGLDAEFSTSYTFVFGVRDGSTTTNSVPYTVNIVDVNEYTPIFNPATYVTTVSESDPIGAPVTTVSATDEDLTAAFNTISYSIVSGNIPAWFALDQNTGEITVSATLNATTNLGFVLIIQASDGTYTATTPATVTITVQAYLLHTLAVLRSVSLFSTIDAAYPTFLVPTADTAPRSVSEDEPPSTPILTLVGQDTDGDTLTFSIVTQTPIFPPFELETVTGILKVPSGLNAEFNTSYTFVFGVRDGSTTTNSVPYTVNIIDVNDNAPVFNPATHFTTVSESVPFGTRVTRVRATDADVTAAFNTITYSIVSGNSPAWFAIDQNTGEIIVSAAFDAATNPSFLLSIQASDGTNTATTPATVTITVYSTILHTDEI